MDRLETVSAASNPAWTAGASAAAPTATDAAARFAAELAKAKGELRKGESLSLVDGHAFARIKGGTRHDMCVNVSGNERSGEAFDLITRNGRTFHVYGEGKDRVVVEVKARTAERDDAAATAPAATGGASAPKTS
jgi:hypothetical protein